jgi:nitronate monooxygenase
MLGADGVVVGTRFWASREAQVHTNLHATALAVGGDDTVRQSVLDIVRERDWPARYTGRVLKNDFVNEWLGREAELKGAKAGQIERYRAAAKTADTSVVATIVGEAVGLIDTIEPAASILERMVSEAEVRLAGAVRYIARSGIAGRQIHAFLPNRRTDRHPGFGPQLCQGAHRARRVGMG